MRYSVRIYSKSLIIGLILFITTTVVHGQQLSNELIKLGEIKAATGEKTELEKWREDLEFIKKELPAKHKNLFHRLDRDLFYREIKELEKKMPSLTRNQAALELSRIVALTKDGHTRLWPLLEPQMKFQLFPISMYMFGDGLYIRKASPEYRDIVGGKVLQIGKMPTRDAFRKVSAYIPADNEMGYREYAPLMLASPEVLQALGISDDLKKVSLKIEKDGKTLTKEVGLLPGKDNSMRAVRRSVGSWVDARENAKTPTPLTLKHINKRFWFEYVPDNKLLYVQLNNVLNGQAKTLEQFFGEVFASARENKPDKLVLDIRHNSGGDNTLIRPIIRGIIQLEEIDRKGHFFVIIGRRTFSAAQNLTNRLETWTEAVFVGEPTASHVNLYGDTRLFKLPNSQMNLHISELWWQNKHARDERKWTAPNIAAEPTFETYVNNIDPAMEAIYRYKPGKSLREMGLAAYQKGDFALIKKILIDFKNDPVNKYQDFEGEVNGFGYSLVRADKLDDAVKIFQINAEVYPESSNAYDSLAEAYMRKGENEKAIKFYKKSLELNPDNSNAVRMLERIKKGGQH
jgi:hypothetical protein